MEKNHKKNLEQLLIKQTEKIFLEIDPATTVIFSKNIKSHCKDLAKKFLKSQKKFQKQMEAIAHNTNSSSLAQSKTEVSKLPVKAVVPVKKVISAHKKEPSLITKEIVPKKAVSKRVRRGNNLTNVAAIQKKAKASIVKNINKTTKKKDS